MEKNDLGIPVKLCKTCEPVASMLGDVAIRLKIITGEQNIWKALDIIENLQQEDSADRWVCKNCGLITINHEWDFCPACGVECG